MNQTINKIKNLYYKKGHSAREVADILEVSMDSVYKLMRKNKLPRRNLSERNRVHFENSPLTFKVKKRLSYQEEGLKIAGLMLYWAEGYKNLGGNTVDLANSDTEMIKLFLEFLRKICGVNESKLRVYLYCYSNQDLVHIKNYWSNITQIPLSQFSKPYVRNDFSMKCGREMEFGMIHVRYSDKKLLRLILGWINDYKKKILMGGSHSGNCTGL